jgi:DNA polymerase-3 subunit gamma/tau
LKGMGLAAQALYRVWRSQTFDELVGQEHVVQTLRNAIVEGRIAHAYLFTGPRGVGKTTVARLMAKAVNCTAPEAERPCGQCESCIAVAEGHSVDVIEMDAASHTSVEDAREIIERVQFRPTIGRYKVYIIDEVHMLSTAAFNALLKTLEEPPGHAIFILATTESHKIPATILSRCQRFTFSRHSIAATVDHLMRVAEGEELTLEQPAAEAIARASTGSMRDALSVLDQLQSYGSRTITLEMVRALLGSSEAAEVTALVEALSNNDLTAALKVVNEVADQGADLRQFVRDLVERMRSLLLISAGSGGDLLDVSDDELLVMQEQAARNPVGQLLQWVKLFSGLDFQLRTSPYGQLPLELAVVEALIGPVPEANASAARPSMGMSRPAAPNRAAPANSTPVQRPAAQRAPEAPKATVSRPSAPPVAAAPAQPVAHQPAPPPAAPPVVDDDPLPPVEEPVLAELQEAPVQASGPSQDVVAAYNDDMGTLEQIEAIWPGVVREMKAYNPQLQALLRNVHPIDVQAENVVLKADFKFHKEKVEQPQHRRLLEDMISKHVGHQVLVTCTLDAEPEEQDLRGQIKKSRRDPWVKAAINVFDADVIGVEPYEQ